MAFAENALFKKFGLPFWLLDDDDELSMDKRDRLVRRDSDSPYNTTDLSLTLLK